MSEHNKANIADSLNSIEDHKFPCKQVAIAAVFLAIVLAVFQLESIQVFSNDFLKLTPVDIVFIPISAFMFLVFWRLMEAKVARPFLALHEAREQATTGSLDEAEAMAAKAKQIEAEAEDTLLAARREALTHKIEAISQSKSVASKVLSEAEDESSDLIKSAGREAEAKTKQLEDELASKSQELVDQLVDKLKQTPGVN